MADQVSSRKWTMRMVFLSLAVLIPVYHLLPLSAAPRQWAPPDVLFALSYAWAVRRPEFVPMIALAIALLLADFLLQRPPGLWTALCLIAIERAKTRERRQAENTFAVEWVTFGISMVLMMVLYRAILFVTVTDAGPLFLSSVKAVFTILIYPLVVLVSHFIFNVRRSQPGDLDAFG